MHSLEAYQHAFTAHLRDAKRHKKPEGVPNKRMAIYREIVFNNLLSAVSACFPVCMQITGKAKWRALVKQFLAHHACNSPLFRDIPHSFLSFITEQTLLTPALLQLAHYEWVELSISQMPKTNPSLSARPDLLNERIVFADAHRLLTYDYPVHTMSKQTPNPAPQSTYLFIFLNQAFEIRFILLNPVTYRLLSHLQSHAVTGLQALEHTASLIQHPQPEAVIAFGLNTLNELLRQQAILGTCE